MISTRYTIYVGLAQARPPNTFTGPGPMPCCIYAIVVMACLSAACSLTEQLLSGLGAFLVVMMPV